MRKKVCIIHKVEVLDPRSFYKQGRSLLKSGYEVSIIGYYDKNAIVEGIRLTGIQCPKKRLYRFIFTNYKMFISALKENAEVYHFHDLDFVPWALMLKLLTKSRVIYDIHEAYPEYILLKSYLPKITRKILSILVYLMEHTAIRFFDAIVPNDNFIAKGFNHKKNVVIFNFPTLDFFKHNNSSVSWVNREYDLFYHGSLPRYHLETMMAIAEILNAENISNRWGLVTNDKSTISWARIEMERRHLSSNFIFLQYTDYLNVYQYLLQVKIGIIPLPPFKKFMKNIPLKMFEFMGCGLPMVLSNLPPSQQFILDTNCAIAVEPNNIREFANAIKYLLNNPAKAVEMGNNGKRLVFDKYNWTSEENKLLMLYENII